MALKTLISVVVVALTVTVLPAVGATFRIQREAPRVSSGNASVVSSERANDALTTQRTEGEADFGGAAYTPFAEVAAKPARRDIQTSGKQSAEEADLTLSTLTVLAAVGALTYLVRRAWSA